MHKILSVYLTLSLCLATSYAIATTSKQMLVNTLQNTQNVDEIVAYFDDTYSVIEKPAKQGGAYRKLLGQTAEGWYVVQDFFQQSNKKLSDPFVVKIFDDLKGTITPPSSTEGTFILWYESGEKLSTTNFKKGKKNGIETRWYKNGQKEIESSFIEGKKNGVETQWYENGQKSSEINFKENKRNGFMTQWHENGQKSSKVNFKDDDLNGVNTKWYENGQKSSELDYKDGKVNENGIQIRWYDNGQKELESSFNSSTNEGYSSFWNKNGQQLIQLNYKEGSAEANITVWNKNGQQLIQADYKDGIETQWNEDGTIKNQESFQEDKLNKIIQKIIFTSISENL